MNGMNQTISPGIARETVVKKITCYFIILDYICLLITNQLCQFEIGGFDCICIRTLVRTINLLCVHLIAV